MQYHSLLILLAVLRSNVLFSQNLVPNHSFENYSECPNKISDLNLSTGWSIPTMATTDYYNECCQNYSSNPLFNPMGEQKPQDGNGFIGVISYHKKGGNYHELAQIRLTQPLKKGKYYKVSYYLCLAEISTYSHPLFGAIFAADSIQPRPIGIHPKFRGFSIPINYTSGYVDFFEKPTIIDSDNWILIKGIYKAKGDEKFLIIGPSGSPDKSLLVKTNSDHALKHQLSYHFIDNVEVIKAKGRKDKSFDHRVVKYSVKTELPSRLEFSHVDKLFLPSEKRIMKKKDAIKNSINPSFETDIYKLDYLADFLYRNKSSHIEIILYSDSQPNSKEHTLLSKRLESLHKVLTKKIDDTQVSTRIESSGDTDEGKLYVEINN